MEGLESSENNVNHCSGSKKAKLDRQVVVLDDDLVHEILVQLPVKQLLRLQCVSKWWYGLIRNPIFIENHRSKTSRMLMAMSRKQTTKDYVLSFHDWDSLELNKVRPNLSIYSFLNIPKSPKFVCWLGGAWSKGIVCIMYNNSIRLCNPALRESKILPPRPSFGRRPTTYDDQVLARGFGITSTGEFKIILIRESFIICKQTRTFPAHLYSSSTNSWKRIGDAPQKPCRVRYSNDCHVLFFNGACHWFASHVLLFFNMTTEVFGELELPNDITGSFGRQRHLIIIHDCLAAVQKDKLWTLGVLDVWVMKEYGIKESWTKQFVIQLQLNIARQLDLAPFSYSKNDEWLLLVNRNPRQLACVSFLTSEVKYCQIEVRHNTRLSIYEESLVRIN